MKNNWLRTLMPHAIAVLALLLLAVLYCKPVLDNKILSQSDNVQWQAMARESLDYKQAHGITSLWTTSMFGGMPTYQLSMESPYNYDSYIPAILSLGLPKPINVLFLAAFCFYILCIVLGANPWIGFAGAVAYTYASYSPIIIVTGHDTKMLSLAYLPAVIAGLILITRKQYLLGSGIMTLFLTYFVAANHLQITYYFFLMLAIIGIAFAVYCIRLKEYKHLLTGALLVAMSVGLSLGSNAVSLWSTYEYSKASTRGGKSELTPLPSQSKMVNGLDKGYAFQWSYGKFETFTLIAPDIYGGSSTGSLSTSSATYKQLESLGVPPTQAEQLIKRWDLYWGDQSLLGTSGPVYLGVVVCLLVILGLFIVESWHKWWLTGITILGIFLAWGSNLEAFNYFMFDHFPLYNKFRAPSQALIIPQLSFAILAVMTLNELINGQLPKQELLKKLKWTGMITAGILVMLLIVSGSLPFTNATGNMNNPGSDDQFHAQLVQMVQGNTSVADGLMQALREDRAGLYRSDVLRSLLFCVLTFGIIWFFIKGKIKAQWFTIGIILLIMTDLLQVDKRYLNDESFMDETSYRNPFQPSAADQQILQDKDPYYRVFNLTGSPFQDAMTSYFHKSVGGYHAAKLQLYEDLIERQISRNNLQVLNMLNTKYIIVPGADRQPVAQRNPDALGNAWFVKQIKWVPNADAEMNALNTLNTRDTVVIDQRYQQDVKGTPQFDSSGSIHLIANNLNSISYKSTASATQFAVFSEVYYKDGWKAFIDDQRVPYSRVNYALRGMIVPAGTHTITFKFEPAVYYSGIKISLFSYFIMLGLLIGGFVVNWRSYKKMKS
ncbi:membrane protein YfhO [Chitinophaga sp. CF118]|uniref:YfhO family protein n=1 Tax=Chitinophaga sp. CF118 TaxID=1884367 RepID=UPI0008E5FC1C|nr:YfhO family protein [Chitinophaga sp. CF118]SFD90176.1 membrane protein YfhO [Chitinophaga sp. CF118]